jgi:hypothetical protein
VAGLLGVHGHTWRAIKQRLLALGLIVIKDVTSRAQRADSSAMYFACLAMLLIPSRRRNATKVSYVDGCILR